MNDTEENDAFLIDHIRRTQIVRNDRTTKSRFTRKKRHAEELKRFQNNVKKALSNNDANQIRAEGSKDKRIKASFIREIKLTHSKNGCH